MQVISMTAIRASGAVRQYSSLHRGDRAPSNWTFNTRYPRTQSGTNSKRDSKSHSKRDHKPYKSKSGVSFTGLALPPSRRLARLGVGVNVKGQKGFMPVTKKKPTNKTDRDPRVAGERRKLTLLNDAERRAAQAKYDAKFAMQKVQKKDVLLESAIDHFEKMGLLPSVLDAIKHLLGENAKPTAVQSLAIPASLQLGNSKSKDGNRAMLIGAETGGGKTLAYLVPLINRLKEQEIEAAATAEASMQSASELIEAIVDSTVLDSASAMSSVSSSKLRRLRRPRAIVLVPSRELVTQATAVAKSLCSHNVRLTVLGTHARRAHPERVAAKLATTPVDIFITTPRELKRLLDSNAVALSKLNEVVIDESDTMFDEGNLPDLEEIRSAIASHAPRTSSSATTSASASDNLNQEDVVTKEPITTYISATFPVTMTNRITELHPNHLQITTQNLHKASTSLKQIFLSVTSSSTKPTLLVDVLKRSAQAGEKRVIVFVNSRDTGTWLVDYLRSKNVVNPRLGGGGVFWVNGQMDPKVRDAVMGLFVQGRKRRLGEDALLDSALGETSLDTDSKLPNGVSSWDSGDKVAILVATDLASRGVDTTAADHIVLYDFPRSAIEYLHRVGRTARNGAGGRATSLLTKRDMRVSDGIEMAVKRGRILG
ncbi:hypothetical protein CcCBS67573_g03917 [Chytriomyces confervae]|uniref:RNA helicase n=1 Tax=Chytriomyces confervae TaxID=246404 RepID=A0A507FGM6_9FUNG|nr:hypothetical protein CcCBS67573_g03917 [Chytriomyces confervae]